MAKGKQEIIPPQGGWKESTWYLVEVAFNENNPVHKDLFYSGFLNGPNGTPGGYNMLVAQGECQGYERIVYLRAIREIVRKEEMDIPCSRMMPFPEKWAGDDEDAKKMMDMHKLEAHLARHKELHHALDELLADWITESKVLAPSVEPTLELMKWSHGQVEALEEELKTKTEERDESGK